MKDVALSPTDDTTGNVYQQRTKMMLFFHFLYLVLAFKDFSTPHRC